MFINKIVSYGNNYVILSIIQKDRARAVSVIWDLFIIVTICSSVYFRGYENPPTPSVLRLHEAGRQFYQGVISGLKSKSTTPVYVSMDLDIWRYVSRGIEVNYPTIKVSCCTRYRKCLAYPCQINGGIG